MSYGTLVFHRTVLYSLLWAASVVELGLTGWRIHHTKSVFDFYDPIVAELLVVSVLTILWVPFAVFLHVFKSRDLQPGSGYKPLHFETAGSFILWVMWLVGGAIATHKWPTKGLAGPGKDGHILLTIVAFSWINFGLLSLAKVVLASHYAAARARADSSRGIRDEKHAPAATA